MTKKIDTKMDENKMVTQWMKTTTQDVYSKHMWKLQAFDSNF
jgi:hypothetical protein